MDLVLWNKNEEYSRSLNLMIQTSRAEVQFRFRGYSLEWDSEVMTIRRARYYNNTGGIISLIRRSL